MRQNSETCASSSSPLPYEKTLPTHNGSYMRKAQRYFLLFAAAVLLAPSDILAKELTTKPNILIILTDDQGRGDYSAFGTKDIHTPNIDRLCQERDHF